MKRLLFFAVATLFVSNAVAVEDIRRQPWNWIFLVGHMGYNVNQMYWQISQNADLSQVRTPNQDEDALPADERTCGPMCQYHSMFIFENTKQTKNLNWIATVSMGLGFCFNSMAGVMLARKKEANYHTFEDISKGISIFSSFLNIASMSYLLDLELYHRSHDIPISTQAPLDQAVTEGLGYFLPALPVAGYGVAYIGRYIHKLGVVIDALSEKVAELVPVPPVAPDNL